MNKKGEGQTVYEKYYQHKRNAMKRNIPFLLSFDAWLAIWIDSGHWEQRGPRRGQYVMARFGDKGPYSVSNVRICPVRENQIEGRQTNGLIGETSPWFGRDHWAEMTPEQQTKRSAFLSERMKGEKNPFYGKSSWADLSDEQRAQRVEKFRTSFNGKHRGKGRKLPLEVRAKQSRAATGRRWVIRAGRRAHAYPGDADYPVVVGSL